jgi:hypothetical protein
MAPSTGGYDFSPNAARQVDDLYQTVLKREADPAGLTYYGNALRSGASLADIEQSLRASKEFSALGSQSTGGLGGIGGLTGTTTADPRDFLKSKYTSEFGREFDQPGLDYWADQIGKGNITVEQVANIFSTSPEGLKYDIANLARGKTDQGFVDPDLLKRYETVQGLYQAEAYRPGDVGGLEYWLGKNLTPEQYAKSFAESPEARVQDAYREVFGPDRGADPEGLAANIAKLASGKTYAQIVADLKNSDEYRKLLADKKIVDTKKLVTDTATGVRYSSPSELAKAMNFGNFPLTAGTRTNESGEIVPTIGLNLKKRPKFNLGLPGFSSLGLTSYQQNPSSTSVFGSPGMFGGAAGITEGAATPSVVDAAATTDQGVVTAAEGGMITSDPVMRRAMVRRPGPVSSKGYGITSNVTTPDENAMAMQTMFQPPGFRDGGPVQYFQEGGEAVEERAPLTFLERFRGTPAERQRAAARAAEATEERVPLSLMERFRGTPAERQLAQTRAAESPPAEESNFRKVMGEVTGGIGGFLGSVGSRAGEILRGGSRSGSGASSTSEERKAALQTQANAQMRQAIDDRDATDREGLTRVSEDRRTQTPPPDPGRRVPERVPYKLEIEKLKAEREANKAQRRENQLLALMQAGFAMAAGRSPNALANLAAGGASGVATLAGLEKDRRAEDTALRREILERELAGERTSEARAEREAARQDRALSREQTGLRSQAEINARREGQIENTRLRLEALVNNPLVPDTDRTRYRSQLEALDRELERRALEESRLSRAILPPGMRQESGGFPARVVGSSPTPQR